MHRTFEHTRFGTPSSTHVSTHLLGARRAGVRNGGARAQRGARAQARRVRAHGCAGCFGMPCEGARSRAWVLLCMPCERVRLCGARAWLLCAHGMCRCLCGVCAWLLCACGMCRCLGGARAWLLCAHVAASPRPLGCARSLRRAST
eukprot:517371-Prymnesium_polylepis.2